MVILWKFSTRPKTLVRYFRELIPAFGSRTGNLPGIQTGTKGVAGACYYHDPNPWVFIDPVQSVKYAMQSLLAHRVFYFRLVEFNRCDSSVYLYDDVPIGQCLSPLASA